MISMEIPLLVREFSYTCIGNILQVFQNQIDKLAKDVAGAEMTQNQIRVQDRKRCMCEL